MKLYLVGPDFDCDVPQGLEEYLEKFRKAAESNFGKTKFVPELHLLTFLCEDGVVINAGLDIYCESCKCSHLKPITFSMTVRQIPDDMRLLWDTYKADEGTRQATLDWISDGEPFILSWLTFMLPKDSPLRKGGAH
jgi:hypothetical protein